MVIRNATLAASTDADIEAAAKNATDWLKSANAWLLRYMGPAALARFVDTTSAQPLYFVPPSQASPADARIRTNVLNMFNAGNGTIDLNP
jgi:hypothetical protein